MKLRFSALMLLICSFSQASQPVVPPNLCAVVIEANALTWNPTEFRPSLVKNIWSKSGRTRLSVSEVLASLRGEEGREEGYPTLARAFDSGIFQREEFEDLLLAQFPAIPTRRTLPLVQWFTANGNVTTRLKAVRLAERMTENGWKMTQRRSALIHLVLEMTLAQKDLRPQWAEYFDQLPLEFRLALMDPESSFFTISGDQERKQRLHRLLRTEEVRLRMTPYLEEVLQGANTGPLDGYLTGEDLGLDGRHGYYQPQTLQMVQFAQQHVSHPCSNDLAFTLYTLGRHRISPALEIKDPDSRTEGGYKTVRLLEEATIAFFVLIEWIGNHPEYLERHPGFIAQYQSVIREGLDNAVLHPGLVKGHLISNFPELVQALEGEVLATSSPPKFLSYLKRPPSRPSFGALATD
jgi:hypothetical protein